MRERERETESSLKIPGDFHSTNRQFTASRGTAFCKTLILKGSPLRKQQAFLMSLRPRSLKGPGGCPPHVSHAQATALCLTLDEERSTLVFSRHRGNCTNPCPMPRCHYARRTRESHCPLTPNRGLNKTSFSRSQEWFWASSFSPGEVEMVPSIKSLVWGRVQARGQSKGQERAGDAESQDRNCS